MGDIQEKHQRIILELAKGNPPSPGSGIFGANFPYETSKIILLGIPWDVTASGKKGTSRGVFEILQQSHELDLFDYSFGAVYEKGIRLEVLDNVLKLNDKYRLIAEKVMDQKMENVHEVNEASNKLNELVYDRVIKYRRDNKIVGVLGGDHSCPYGLIKALAEEGPFGILHIDAHHDLRQAYCGFKHSHASIFYNVLNDLDAIEKLVSVGIRDFSLGEKDFAKKQGERVKTFYDEYLFQREAHGCRWQEVVEEILDQLPKEVYISIDIDGLNPSNCPSTGTPVPGGLSYQQLVFLLTSLKKSKKKILGFDLVEVAGGGEGWDANVGARLAYKLCGLLDSPIP